MATAKKSRAEKRRETHLAAKGHMEFTLPERIVLLGLLPRQGNLLTLRIIHDLQMELSPSEEETKEAEFHPTEGGGVGWSPKANEMRKTVIIGEKAREVLQESIEAGSKKEKLEIQFLSLFERFVDIEELLKEQGEKPSANGKSPEAKGE